jgi:hypothetical protein
MLTGKYSCTTPFRLCRQSFLAYQKKKPQVFVPWLLNRGDITLASALAAAIRDYRYN